MSRYYVDKRVGCVAVRDRDMDRDMGLGEYPGLHPDTPGVVQFWRGRHVPRWKKFLRIVPSHVIWEVPRRHVRDAKRLARRMNAEAGR